MAKKKGKGNKGRKIRIVLRRNRSKRTRQDDWTQRYRDGDAQDALVDERSSESVRGKGDLSRKRTIIVDDDGAPLVDKSNWFCGVIRRCHGHVCLVVTDSGDHWECTVRRTLRTREIDQRSPVIVGDRVWISDHASHHDGQSIGVVEHVEPRLTTLSRRDFRKREHAIVANADRLLVVASVGEPTLKPHLIDRYLIAAMRGSLTPIVVFNKWDLLDTTPPEPTEGINERDAEDTFTVDDIIEEFEAIGVHCIRTSVPLRLGIDELRDALKGHTTVLSGQSGVGKSSLINAMQPGLRLRTAVVSTTNEKGRHTTTLAEWFPLEVGGAIIDTPGIRQFDLWSIKPGELEAYFAEFVPLVAQCRFNDCHHQEHDAGCAILDAVDDGRVSDRRYFSYLKILMELSAKRS